MILAAHGNVVLGARGLMLRGRQSFWDDEWWIPSWPLELSPKVKTRPLEDSASTWRCPHAADTMKLSWNFARLTSSSLFMQNPHARQHACLYATPTRYLRKSAIYIYIYIYNYIYIYIYIYISHVITPK
jgi:hypothetical protein